MAIASAGDGVGDRRRVAEIEGAEALPVEEEAERLGRLAGAAAVGDQERLGEKLHRADDREHDAKHDDRLQQRQGDEEELPRLRDAVQRRRLVDVLGNRLQSGEDDDGVVSRPAPGDAR